jgi:hypothetical protein
MTWEVVVFIEHRLGSKMERLLKRMIGDNPALNALRENPDTTDNLLWFIQGIPRHHPELLRVVRDASRVADATFNGYKIVTITHPRYVVSSDGQMEWVITNDMMSNAEQIPWPTPHTSTTAPCTTKPS